MGALNPISVSDMDAPAAALAHMGGISYICTSAMSAPIYPIGIQSFSELRARGYTYVDKTALIHRLACSHKYYFLSRPRRFGKSLLVSAMAEYFAGNRALFSGLELDSLQPGDWPAHPVIHFDFSRQAYRSPSDLSSFIALTLSRYEDIYGRDPREATPEQRLAGIIERAHTSTGMQTVLLIDEYDLPIVNCNGATDLMGENRRLLRGLYGVIKGCDRHLRFLFVTGVGRLGKTSIFSSLNNILDISLLPAYSTICGITDSELAGPLASGVEDLSAALGQSVAETTDALRNLYGGYHFADDLRDTFNPFSLLSALATQRLSDFWAQSGTPALLTDAIRRHPALTLTDFDRATIGESTLLSADIIHAGPIPLMYFTGYLTIAAFDPALRQYTLTYPNAEVKNSFLNAFLPSSAPDADTAPADLIARSVANLRKGDIETFLRDLKIYFAAIPYEIQARNEYFYQNIIYCLTSLLGLHVTAEFRTSSGRIDILLATPRFIYIIEFKLDSSPEVALRQIDDNGYATPFLHDSRTIVKVGVNFSSRSRTIESWQTSSSVEKQTD